MQREHLLKTIEYYKNKFLPIISMHSSFDKTEELEILQKFASFINEHSDCFDRSCAIGHITGSALVITPDLQQVVLTHHKKLDKWLQLGGHADGCTLAEEVAMREAREESGLGKLSFFESQINTAGTVIPFDFDIHFIPTHKDTPSHLHYDIRYLIVSHEKKLTISDESNDLRWFSLEAAKKVNTERSMWRQFDKLSYLRTQFGIHH